MGTARYVINWEELTNKLREDLLKNIKENIDDKHPEIGMTKNEFESWLSDILDLMPSIKYNGLKKKIKEFILHKVDGIQKSNGKLLDVPPLVIDNIEEFKFDKDILLTGIHLNQDGWQKEDRWSFYIDKIKIFDNVTIKEVGEHKYFNTYYKVKANTPIYFILHNNSGFSRHSLVDLDYIEGDLKEEVPEPPPPTPTPVEPTKPDVDAIKHEWDIAIKMIWEENTGADMDLHVFMRSTHVCFWNPQQNGLYLDFDFREHLTNSNPEICSVKGNKNKKLLIFIHNYNGQPLNEKVTVQIIKNLGKGNTKILKEYKLDNIQDSRVLQSVCTIDLKTLKITDLHKNIVVNRN